MSAASRKAAPYFLIVVLWALLILGSRGVSLTMDEPLHITGGYAVIARGRGASWLLLSRGHPPLINVLEALPIYLAQPTIPLENLDGWESNVLTYADRMMRYLLPPERTEVLARISVMYCTVLLGAAVYDWGRRIGGAAVGIAALFLLVFDPLVLAHGRLATTDAGVTTIGTVFLYTCWRWCQSRQWRWAIAAGVFGAFALLAKFTAILHLGVWGIAAVVVLLQAIRPSDARGGLTPTDGWRPALMQAVTTGLTALGIIWLTYGFTFGEVESVPIPLPAPLYWRAFIEQAMTASQRLFIGFGEQQFGTRWWYYPLNILIKNPVPLLIATLVGGFGYLRSSRRRQVWWLLVSFPVIYAAAAVAAGMNVSYRHMLPVHPITHIVTASGIVSLMRHLSVRCGVRDGGRAVGMRFISDRSGSQRLRTPYAAVATALLVIGTAWYVLGTLNIFPDELTYFNELVGGPAAAPRVLVDYTQDWGQGLKALRSYLADRGSGKRPHVFTFTPARPEHYGIDYDVLTTTTRFHPLPGSYVIGPAPIYGLNGPGKEQYTWFRRADPDAFLAHSLYYYEVGTKVAWLAECTNPVPPLTDEAIAEGYGQQVERRIPFDCSSSWLYPAGALLPRDGDLAASQIGAYAFHGHLFTWQERWPSALAEPVPQDPFLARHLAPLRLAYDQPSPSLLPPLAIYECEGELRGLAPHESTYYTAPVATRPRDLDPAPRSLPIDLVGPLQFLGVVAFKTNSGLDVETWWRVVAAPAGQPFSIFVHAINSGGAPLGSSDGLGVPSGALSSNDVLVQRHQLPAVESLPGGDSDIWLRIGAYWLPGVDSSDLVRFAVLGTQASDAIFVPLDSLLISPGSNPAGP